MSALNLNEQIETWWYSRLASFQNKTRPFITLSYAQSLDGSITTRQGEAFNISGPESMSLTHQLRSLHDGILVGVGTVLSDDPQLTVRQWHGSNPQPVVVDSCLRTPKTARICNHPNKKCWILTRQSGSDSYGSNVEILTVACAEENDQKVPLVAAMNLLREKGIRSLMIEGGGQIITAFLQAGLADSVVLTMAPRLVSGYSAVGSLGTTTTNDNHIHIQSLNSARAGKDLIIWGDLHYQGPNS